MVDYLPWKACFAVNERPSEWWFILGGGRSLTRDGVFDKELKPSYFTEEEARLIGAAPELADALSDVEGWWEGRTMLSPVLQQQMWERVRHALVNAGKRS